MGRKANRKLQKLSPLQRMVENILSVSSLGSKFSPFRVGLFSEESWCAEKETGSHKSCHPYTKWQKKLAGVRGMFEMNCLLSSSSISTWGTIKTNTYLYRAIQYLHNGV